MYSSAVGSLLNELGSTKKIICLIEIHYAILKFNQFQSDIINSNIMNIN